MGVHEHMSSCSFATNAIELLIFRVIISYTGTGLDVNDRVYHKSHADTGFISDSELTDHDYDVIGLPAVPDANKNSRCLSKGTTTAGCVNHEYHHYGLDKLDDDAKILVERCARYYDGDHHEVRASFDRGASPLPVIELDSADGAGSTLAAASMLMTAVAVPASRPVKSYHHHSAYQTGQGQLSRVPVVLVLAFLVGYVCLGAMVFSAWEEWQVSFFGPFDHTDLQSRNGSLAGRI